MQQAFRRSPLAFVDTILLTLPMQVWAWGNTGREAVAWVAWHQMDTATKARVIALLQLVPTLHSRKRGKLHS
jgi:hypothetical protein